MAARLALAADEARLRQADETCHMLRRQQVGQGPCLLHCYRIGARQGMG
jgi:hypothetical protein